MPRLLVATIAITAVLSACPVFLGQAPSDAQNSSVPVQTAPTVTKPTELLAPAIDQLGRTVSQTHLERWKGSVRDETDGNLRSIERDLQETLPPLLQTADAAPSSVAAALPVLRNLDALVAVALRVTITARGTAPQGEAQALNEALNVLEGGRRSLDDQVEQLAAAQEKQLSTLQQTVKSQAASLAAAQTPAAAPPVKIKRSRKTSKPQQ